MLTVNLIPQAFQNMPCYNDWRCNNESDKLSVELSSPQHRVNNQFRLQNHYNPLVVVRCIFDLNLLRYMCGGVL